MRRMTRGIAAAGVLAAVVFAGCSCGSPSGTPDGGPSPTDAGLDATTAPTDAGLDASDASIPTDATPVDDSGPRDAGSTADASSVDGGTLGDASGICAIAYQQDFESSSLFSETSLGSQAFTDGTDFFDAGGGSYLRSTTSAHGGLRAMNVYSMSSGARDNTTLAFPAPATAVETLRVSFWAYNPFVTSYDIELVRAGGTAVSVTVPGGDWFHVTADVVSTLSTSDLILRLGLIPNSTGGFTFRIDDVVIERCP